MNWIKSLSKPKTPFNSDVLKDAKIASFFKFINKMKKYLVHRIIVFKLVLGYKYVIWSYYNFPYNACGGS